LWVPGRIQVIHENGQTQGPPLQGIQLLDIGYLDFFLSDALPAQKGIG